MAVRIRAFDCNLVSNHVTSGEGVLGSNPTSPKFLPNVCAARRERLRNAPLKEHHTRYITLFFKGTYSVISFYAVIRMSDAGLREFLM